MTANKAIARNAILGLKCMKRECMECEVIWRAPEVWRVKSSPLSSLRDETRTMFKLDER
jgi:hypothetical protein